MKLNSQIFRFSTSKIVFAVLMWSLLLWRAGYRFGTGDHPEYLPYVLYLNDHSFYQKDFFVLCLQEKVPNERSVICYLLLPFVNNLEIACFAFQFLFTVLLVLGLQKLGKILIGNLLAAQMAILLNFIIFFDRGLGNVELYADAFQGSGVSVAIIAFALCYYFTEKYLLATILMSIASIIHPVEGITVFLVMLACIFVFTFWQKKVALKTLLQCMAVYGFTAGAFIIMFLAGKMDGVNALSKSFDNEAFFRIYFEFRHAHHYIFSYFPVTDKILFFLFISINLIWSYTRNKFLLWFNLFTLAGTFIYIICTDYMHLTDIAGLQFYKVSQWTKFYALLLVVNYGYDFLKDKITLRLSVLVQNIVYAALAVSIVVMLFFKPELIGLNKAHYQFSKEWKKKNDMVIISEQIDTSVDKRAVFVQPFSTTELKYFGRVSSFVDFKAFVKNRSHIFEWHRRIKLVYGISADDSPKGFELEEKAEKFFFNLSKENTEQLKREGVTHLLTANKEWKYGKLLFANTTYAVYQL